jgi:hypothetical protein
MNAGLSRVRELSGHKKTIAIGAAIVVILIAVWSLIAQSGVLYRPDSLAGYFALIVPPNPNATPEQQFQDGIFGFDRLALNGDGTFRLGGLRGRWRRSGSTLRLEPETIPKPEEFYSKTSMVSTLSTLFKPTEFTISSDEKRITVVNAANGPLEFVKTTDVMR